ncbi:MAG TPA: NAD(P)/FAD-dependent oxidoreductase [Thermomicrobiales bacterium]|nr:NAD(P)/FAD-dependent oxidoreductase [Thermomicrobiales bacterium]
MTERTFDVVIAGGGLAGSTLGGVLARGGLQVVVIERERVFRDRIRGEFTWPWGRAEIDRLGLTPVFESIGALPLLRMDEYLDGAFSRSIDVVPRPGLTFQHAPLQEALLSWAAEQGAEIIRPARAVEFEPGDLPSVRVQRDGAQKSISGRLVVAATGRESGARKWTGASSETDPEHHRFGGVSIQGAAFADGSLLLGQNSPEQALLFHLAGEGLARLYLRTFDDVLQATPLAQSFETLVEYVRPWFTPEVLADARQVGPLGFFPNSTTWATKLTAPGVALIGDVAGSADPSGGHGTSLVFRDVRVLSDLLLASDDWRAALARYETERGAYYDVIRARDRWYGEVAAARGQQGDERRARQAKARELDPTLAGFGAVEFLGPDGLVPDEEHRRIYFGEHISPDDLEPRSDLSKSVEQGTDGDGG